MSLISCSECGKEIPETGSVCPYCGHSLKPDPQMNLFDASAPVDSFSALASASSSADSFGCCASYRACSDAGKCLISDRDYSVNCLYRKNLEAGRIFYGKNANAFDKGQYAALCRRVDSLSSAARSAFDWMLIDFKEYHRAARRCIVRNEHIPELSAVDLFEFRPLGSEFPALCSCRSFLKPAVISHPEYGPLFKKAQEERRLIKRERKIPRAGTKEFLVYWLNHDGISLRNQLAEPYRFAYLPPEKILYAEELYRDTLFSGCDKRIYPLSPFAADGLLSPADFETEESRRLKLSHGYTREEKEQRLASVQKLHTARNNPFLGKMCVITGVLSRMERSEAFSEIMERGGRVSDTPVNSMEILILGAQEWSDTHGGAASRKVQKAVDLQKQGKDVKIISEDEFYSLLEKYSV